MFECVKKLIKLCRLNRFIKNITIDKIDSVSGYDFEEYVVALFESAGFECRHTPKSKDNGVDLIASKNNMSIAIQTKLYYKTKVSNSAVQEVYTGKSFYDCDMAVVITNSHFSAPAIAVSEKLDVGLIDRETLVDLISKPYKERKYILDNLIYKLYTNKTEK